MKKVLSKTEAHEKINEFFSKDEFDSDEIRKIKKIAMAYKIKIGKYRRRFCKKCFSQLRGKIKISKEFKSVKCEKCGFLNRFRMD